MIDDFSNANQSLVRLTFRVVSVTSALATLTQRGNSLAWRSSCGCGQITLIKKSGVFANPCMEWQRAQSVSYKCGNRYQPYDGEWVRNLHIIDGGAPPVTSIAVDITGCDSEVGDRECWQHV